jgi:tRNA A37 methylthiotransferase MiaB
MEDMVLSGRLQSQAPEIDGMVYLSETEAEPGEFVDVTITDATEYDLMGTTTKSKHHPALAASARNHRVQANHK